MNDEQQAEVLARWLEQPPGTPPPDGLDPDVVEGLVALRPERVAMPRLDLDALLDSVSSGPLAAGSATAEGPGAEVVAFPGTAVEPPAANTQRAPRWSARWGGAGVLLAAAATLALVAWPMLQSGDLPAPTAAPELALDVPRPVVAPADALEQQAQGGENTKEGKVAESGVVATADQLAVAPEAEPMVKTPASTTAGLERTELDAVADLDEDVVDEVEIAAEAAYDARQQSTIPEMAQRYEPQRELAASAGAVAAPAPPVTAAPPSAAPAYDAPAAYEPSPVYEAEALAKEDRRRPNKKAATSKDRGLAAEEAMASDDATPAAPSGQTTSSWRDEADAGTLRRIDVANAVAQSEAASGNYTKAASVVAETVGPPARAGQAQAALAARYYLQAGDAASAWAVVQRGLALSSAESPELQTLRAVASEVKAAVAAESSKANAQ